MAGSERVSIIIPCYRRVDLAAEAVHSALRQRHQPVEVIVVDDGSPEDVRGALGALAEHVTLLRQDNAGQGAARNAGLAAATGEFVKFLDSDDLLTEDCIAREVAAIRDRPGTFSVIGYYRGLACDPSQARTTMPPTGNFHHRVLVENFGPPMVHLFHTEDVRAVGGFRGDWHEDHDLLLRLIEHGCRGVAVSALGGLYRDTPTSVSKDRRRLQQSRLEPWLRHVGALDVAALDTGALLAVLRGAVRLHQTMGVARPLREPLRHVLAALPRLTADMGFDEQCSLLRLLGRLAAIRPCPLGDPATRQALEALWPMLSPRLPSQYLTLHRGMALRALATGLRWGGEHRLAGQATTCLRSHDLSAYRWADRIAAMLGWMPGAGRVFLAWEQARRGGLPAVDTAELMGCADQQNPQDSPCRARPGACGNGDR